MKCIIYGSKYEAILKMLLVPGRECFEECSLDLICFKLETNHSVFFLGKGADFIPPASTRFFRHFSESI